MKNFYNKIINIEEDEAERKFLQQEIENFEEKLESLQETCNLLKSEKFKLQEEKQFIVFSFNELYDLLKIEKENLESEMDKLKREIRYSEEFRAIEKRNYEEKLEEVLEENKKIKEKLKEFNHKCEVRNLLNFSFTKVLV